MMARMKRLRDDGRGQREAHVCLPRETLSSKATCAAMSMSAGVLRRRVVSPNTEVHGVGANPQRGRSAGSPGARAVERVAIAGFVRETPIVAVGREGARS